MVGCPFDCAYCPYTSFVCVRLDVETFVDRVEALVKSRPSQTLWKLNNRSDTLALEPEYGLSAALVQRFARLGGPTLPHGPSGPDAALLNGLEIGPAYTPGEYSIKFSSDGKSWELTQLKTSRKSRGTVGDSIACAISWMADARGGDRVEIKGVPVKIVGTKALQPEKGGSSVQWDFDITSGIPLLGGLIASFAGDELKKNLEDEFKVLKASV